MALVVRFNDSFSAFLNRERRGLERLRIEGGAVGLKIRLVLVEHRDLKRYLLECAGRV